MRDKFIEILSEDPCEQFCNKGDSFCSGCPYEDLWKTTETVTKDGWSADLEETCFEAKYADHLIAKGAIIPPVDIGDKVWYIEGGYYNASYMRPREIEVTEINKKKSGKTIEWAFVANGTRYKFTSLGKTVFLDRASTEEAIEKRRKKSKKS